MPASPSNVVPPEAKPSAAEVAQKAAQTTISVSQMGRSAEPEKPPKPGSAKAKLFSDMDQKFGGEEAQPASRTRSPSKSAAPAVTTAAEATPDAAPSAEGAEPAAPATAPSASSPQPEPAKTGKVSPWKLVDQFKERAAKAEARILELEKQIVPETQVKEAQHRVEAMQKQIEEMQSDLRFTHAEKYDPDILKAKEDYQRAFARAMQELKTVTINDGGTQRRMTTDDLAELAFMDLQQAHSVAKEVFGDLAPEVMGYRNEIRRLWDAQQAKMEDVKKNGAAREQQKMESRQKAFREMNDFITKTYQQASKEVMEDPKVGHYFKPRDNDKEWNVRLEKGYKLVDEAYAQNPTDPKLTPEQRRDVVRRHAAIRNRAASWSALRGDNETLRKRVSELEAELKGFKETTPKTGGRTAEPVAEKARGIKGLFTELEKIAH